MFINFRRVVWVLFMDDPSLTLVTHGVQRRFLGGWGLRHTSWYLELGVDLGGSCKVGRPVMTTRPFLCVGSSR